MVLDPPLQDGPDLDPGAEELIDWEGASWFVVRHPHLSEDEYVAKEIEITRRANLKDHDRQRLSRVERYARWRYRGYCVGEIRSL